MKKQSKVIFMSLEELYKATSAAKHQVTAQEILNGRTCVGDGWTDIEIPHTVQAQVCRRLAEIFGGVKATQDRVYTNLMNDRRQHWGLGRVVLQKFGTGPVVLHYIAGQDMPTECKDIRNSLKS